MSTIAIILTVAIITGAFTLIVILISKTKDRRIQTLEQLYAQSETENRRLADLLATTREELVAANTTLEQYRLRDTERQEEYNRRTETMKTEFQNMANTILKARSAELTATNDERLGLLLKPLTERLSLFREQIEKAFDSEMRDKNSLREEIHRLTELNTKMSADANNLTKALKGDVKQQGCWGEVILERVLESSGLREGEEYEREVVVKDDDGTVYRPDVIIKLPDQKHIIIDSKVSLTAYNRYIEATDDDERTRAQNDLVASVTNHIKLLSDKHYERAVGLNTPDFVLLFMPIEGAFALAVQTRADIYSTAWARKIVIVSPSTLLATLRTVGSIWQQENQTKNALEIARIAGTLYDKLANMRSDFDNIDTYLEKARKAYLAAMNKLSDGRDSIYSKAERLRELGAKTSKQLTNS